MSLRTYYNYDPWTWSPPPVTLEKRFEIFLNRLTLTSAQRFDGYVKSAGVTSCLNKHYYGVSSPSANTLWVGSWGKSTEIRPPRDIDLLFIIPGIVYYNYRRFKYRIVSGNQQSRLLQDVKSVLAKTYSRTQLRGDGQVVVVPFDSYCVEVVPAFWLEDGKFLVCDTHWGGRYKTTDPITEIHAIEQSDSDSRGNTRNLIRMMKRWQEYCNVPLKSFCVELLCMEFLDNWALRGQGYTYYDWMVRDFLAYLVNRSSAWVFAPGTQEAVYLGDAWVSRAITAFWRSVKACALGYNGRPLGAARDWQNIFGPDFPTA